MAITSLQRGGRQLQLTALGRLLAQLPMDPCAANLILQGVMMGCGGCMHAGGSGQWAMMGCGGACMHAWVSGCRVQNSVP